jgi:hypothetical protein
MPERWQHELRKLKGLEPPRGLWERATLGPRREPPRAHRAWQAIAPIAAALAVMVVVVGTLVLVRPFGQSFPRPGSPAGGHAERLVDPRLGWTIRVPAGLAARHFLNTGRVTIDGVRVTSFPPDLRVPGNGTPPMGWLRRFPADGVAVQIWSGEGGPAGLPPLRDSTFPLSPSSFHQIRPYVGGTEPHPWYREGYGDGYSFNAAVWLGPHANRADQQAAWAVVQSLRFPRLREGTLWHGTYYVLGPASRYPTGSVTRFPASSLPGSRSFPGGFRSAIKGFYLIHAPRAFYVITRLFQQPMKPYTTCTMAFNSRAFQFSCPGTGLRWNRIGQPLGAPTGKGPDLALPLRVATVAQDGHVLFSPFFGGLLPVDLHGNPWR